jgi:hypothetical protein
MVFEVGVFSGAEGFGLLGFFIPSFSSDALFRGERGSYLSTWMISSFT